MNAPVIEVNKLSKRFGELVAVDDVSFNVQRGAIFGLLGPNGSGKSTIIRMMLGILPQSSGSCSVLGFNSSTEAELIKPRVGYMSQKFSLYEDLSVKENLDFYGRIYGLDNDRLNQRRRDVTDLTGIGNRLNQLAGNLSGGWKQRLALACSLIHQPDVIFLDEPTAGIDPVARRELWDLLFELSGRGVTLLVTTHYMDEAERCTDVGYLYMSRLLVLGKPGELKQLPQVTPDGSIRYDVTIPKPSIALGKLRTIEGVRDATLFGEKIHLLIDDSLSPETIQTKLNVAADQIQFQKTTPNLEDVFVTLTSAAEKKGAQTVMENVQASVDRIDEDAPAADDAPSNSNSPEQSEGDASDANDETPRMLDERGHELPHDSKSPSRGKFLGGLWAILVKEFVHVRRQPTTLFFMFVVPILQTIIFGYAIDTQVENIPAVILDLDGRKDAQLVVEAFSNTRRFNIKQRVFDQSSFDNAMQSGRAQVGIIIPPNFAEQLQLGEQAHVQVLIDGSDSQVATTAQSTAQLLGQTMAIQRARGKAEAMQLAPARNVEGETSLPIEVRTRLLYNPDLESSHFFVPGLIGIILQLVTLFLTSFAVVRERELGTLEQLFVTPVSQAGLIFGKLIPYAVVGMVEVILLLVAMIYVFGVPINGSVTLLFLLSLLFTICSLSLGLFISTIARTQLEAFSICVYHHVAIDPVVRVCVSTSGNALAHLLDQFPDSGHLFHRNPPRDYFARRGPGGFDQLSGRVIGMLYRRRHGQHCPLQETPVNLMNWNRR